MDKFVERLERLLCSDTIEPLVYHIIANNNYSMSDDQIRQLSPLELYEFIANEVCSPEHMNKYPRLYPCFNLVVERVQELGGDYLQLYDNH